MNICGPLNTLIAMLQSRQEGGSGVGSSFRSISGDPAHESRTLRMDSCRSEPAISVWDVSEAFLQETANCEDIPGCWMLGCTRVKPIIRYESEQMSSLRWFEDFTRSGFGETNGSCKLCANGERLICFVVR